MFRKDSKEMSVVEELVSPNGKISGINSTCREWYNLFVARSKHLYADLEEE